MKFLAVVLLAAALLAPIRLAPHAAEAADLPKADHVLVLKGERKLFLMRQGAVYRVYSIHLGSHPKGPKIFEYDGRTPEGDFVIDARNPNSRFYRALHISYPTPAQQARTAKYGTTAGGEIFVHGTPPGAKGDYSGDWTDGCISVRNSEMTEIWDAVDIGTPIEIRP